MVEGTDRPVSACRAVLKQDQLQRRVRNGEVGIARPALGRFGAEKLGVELDRFLDIADVESELEPLHGDLP